MNRNTDSHINSSHASKFVAHASLAHLNNFSNLFHDHYFQNHH